MDKFFSYEKNKKYFEENSHDFLSSNFERQCWLSGLIQPGQTRPESVANVAHYLGICERTARRWLDGDIDPHPCATRLLMVRWSGVPPCEAWEGWRVVADSLVSPSGFVVGPDIEQRINYLLTQINIERQRAGQYASALAAQNKLAASESLMKLAQAARLIKEVVG